MKFRLTIIFWSCMIFCSCNSPQKEVASRANVPVNIEEERPLSFYDLFSSLEIIPMETSDSVVMDVSLRQMHIRDHSFYFWVGKDEQIWEFDGKGRFVRRINHYGTGPGEYTLFAGFHLNRFNRNLEVLSLGSIYQYDSLGGKFKSKIPLDCKETKAFHHFIGLTPAKYLLLSNSKTGNKMLWYDVDKQEVYAEDYDIPSFIFFNTPYHHTWSPFYVYNDTVHFVQGYNGDVFTVDTIGNLTLKYHFDFGKYNFDISDLPEKDIKYYIRHKATEGANYANRFITYGENSRYYICSFSFKNRFYQLVLNKETKEVFTFQQYKEGCYAFPMYMDEEALYTCLMPVELAHTVNPDLLSESERKKWDSITSDDNLIVVKYNFKQKVQP